jgi:hypothetical protein
MSMTLEDHLYYKKDFLKCLLHFIDHHSGLLGRDINRIFRRRLLDNKKRYHRALLRKVQFPFVYIECLQYIKIRLIRIMKNKPNRTWLHSLSMKEKYREMYLYKIRTCLMMRSLTVLAIICTESHGNTQGYKENVSLYYAVNKAMNDFTMKYQRREQTCLDLRHARELYNTPLIPDIIQRCVVPYLR